MASAILRKWRRSRRPGDQAQTCPTLGQGDGNYNSPAANQPLWQQSANQAPSFWFFRHRRSVKFGWIFPPHSFLCKICVYARDQHGIRKLSNQLLPKNARSILWLVLPLVSKKGILLAAAKLLPSSSATSLFSSRSHLLPVTTMGGYLSQSFTWRWIQIRKWLCRGKANKPVISRYILPQLISQWVRRMQLEGGSSHPHWMIPDPQWNSLWWIPDNVDTANSLARYKCHILIG